MSYRSLMTAMTLYRSRTITLEQAADRSGVSQAKMESALRSRGIPIRDESQSSRGRP